MDSSLRNILVPTSNGIRFGREEAVAAMAAFKGLAGFTGYRLPGKTTTLSDGGALSPSLAAACLWDLARTEVFLNGAIQAVRDRLERTTEAVHFVEFGSGPLAPFAHFLALAIPDERLKIGYVDFFSENVNSASQISCALGLQDRVFCARAADLLTAYSRGLRVDVAFIEVMGSTLLYEPQAPVAFNLARDLPEDVVFLPNKVTVSAQLGDLDLGPVVSLDDGFRSKARHSGLAVRRSMLEVDETLRIPDCVDRSGALSLETTVDVYGRWRLPPRASLITRSHLLIPSLDPQIKAVRIAYQLSGRNVRVEF